MIDHDFSSMYFAETIVVTLVVVVGSVVVLAVVGVIGGYIWKQRVIEKKRRGINLLIYVIFFCKHKCKMDIRTIKKTNL